MAIDWIYWHSLEWSCYNIKMMIFWNINPQHGRDVPLLDYIALSVDFVHMSDSSAGRATSRYEVHCTCKRICWSWVWIPLRHIVPVNMTMWYSLCPVLKKKLFACSWLVKVIQNTLFKSQSDCSKICEFLALKGLKFKDAQRRQPANSWISTCITLNTKTRWKK